MNSNLILAGAIPACILAFAVDTLGAYTEKRIGAASFGRRKAAGRSGTRLSAGRIMVALIILACLGGFVWKSVTGSGRNGLTIGGKDFTEQSILVYMYAQLIKATTDLKVTPKTNLGGAKVCPGVLQTGDIDMYVEYSGTAYGDVLGLPLRTAILKKSTTP